MSSSSFFHLIHPPHTGLYSLSFSVSVHIIKSEGNLSVMESPVVAISRFLISAAEVIIKVGSKGKEPFCRPLHRHQNFILAPPVSELRSFILFSSTPCTQFGVGVPAEAKLESVLAVDDLRTWPVLVSVFCITSTGMHFVLFQSSSSGSSDLTAFEVIILASPIFFFFL